ncbi:glutathione S-transferase family protein [Tistrella sp. BH-R2-4]|uniref:Glutathione S-transferase family protein n=1 Tax=Tistrella arctica TaxID=3133430 RepID=A0ABU9YLV1_9PROT
MTEELVYYTNPMSRGRIGRWMLEEIGMPYQTVVLGYDGAMKTADYLAINPMGKVPALRHGDAVVTEGAAICAYLADAFPAAGLGPRPGERAAYYRWLFFGAGPMEAAVTNKALGIEIPPERQRMVGYGSFETMVDTLDAALRASLYLAGDRFTAVDIYTGLQLGWGLQFGSIPPRPAFTAYWARISDRESFRRANALDDAAAAGGAG